MANRFLNNIRINDEYTFPENDGSAGQAIVTDGSGNLSFGSAVASSADSTESIHISVKNTSGSQILKGTPVYVTGETGNSGKIEIAPADASDSAKMPALGILESTLSNNAEGFCVQGGLLEGLATATIDGTSTTANDTVYVKAGGGLTMTKPTGSNLIQNIAKVARVHASNGSLVVSSILRTNDVPNLNTGKIWVGTATNTAESGVVHLDEGNGRMGIGTTSPQSPLSVKSNSFSSANSGITLLANGSTDIIAAIGERATNGGRFHLYDSGVAKVSFYSDGTDNFIANGNVGIGTTSPATKLNVAGNIAVTSGNYISFVDSNLTYNTIKRSTSVGGIQIDTGGSASMNILDNGRVGIGRTPVAAALEVEGQVRVTGTSGYTFHAGGDTDGGMFSTADGTINFRTNGSERIRINSSGNVGIGTTSPSYKLSVNGTIQTDMLVGYTFPTNSFLDFDYDQTVSSNSTALASIADIFYLADTNGNNPSTNVAHFFATGNADIDIATRLASIYHNGKFQLHSYGSGTFTGTATQRLGVDSSGNVIEIPIGSGAVDGSGTANYVTKWSDADTIGNSIIYDDGTDIGISTSAPTHKLHVNGDARVGTNLAVGNTFGNKGTNQGINFESPSTALQTARVDADAFRFFFGGSGGGGEVFRILEGGNVGIGTTNPSQKLHVNGISQFDSDVYQYGVNYGLYHGTIEDDYYFDDYNGSRYLSLFYKNAYSDILRYQSIDNLEYWDGSAWQDMSSQAANLKNLLDGRKDTNWYVPSTYYKFRFTTNLATSWPTRAMIWLETSWTGSTYPGGTVTIEEDVSGTWTTRVTADFNSGNGVTNWGLMARADSALHTGVGSGSNTTRITVDFYGWSPSNPSYVTLPLQNIMITSQFSGSANTDYSALLNYDKTLTAPGKLYITTTDTNTSSTSALVLNGNEVEKRTLGSNAFNSTNFWHSGNDGAGSGLDADLLDGVQGSSYLRSDTADTATGAITFSGQVNLNSTVRLDPNGTNFEIDTDSTDRVIFAFNKNGTRNWSFKSEGSNLNFYRESGSGNIEINNNRILTTADEGSGNGLDADTLDGQHGSYYATASHNHDSDYVNVSGDTMTGSLTIQSSGYRELKIDQTDSAAARIGVSSGSSEAFLMASTAGAGHSANSPVVKILGETTAVTEYARFTSAGLGIGETNPIAALHINKSGVPQLLLDGGGNTTGDIVVPTGEILQIGHWAPSTSTYTDRLRIAADGNVGIGETNPDTILHIKDSGTGLKIEDSSGTDTYAQIRFAGGDLDIYSRNGSSYGDIQWWRNNGTTAEQMMRLNGSTDKSLRLYAYGSGNITGTATKMLAVTSAGIVIEETLPSTGVTSVSSGDGIVLTGTSAAPTVNIDYSGTDNAILTAVDASGSAINTTAKIWYSDDATIAHANVSDLPFASSSHNHDSDYVNVTGDTMTGALTISTNSPALILNDANSTNTTNQTGYISLRNQGSETGWVGFGSSGNSDLTVKNNSGKVVLNGSSGVNIPNGNVGIGTTDPSDGDLNINNPRLHVLNTGSAGTYNLVARFQAGPDSNNTGAAIAINHSNDRGLLIKAGRKDSDRPAAYFDLIDSSGSTTNLLTMGEYGSNFNVGIGTTSPGEKLEVAGSAAAILVDSTSGAGLILDRSSTTYDNNIMFRTGGSTKWRLWMGGSDNTLGIRDEANATEMVTFETGGNVGIGETNPGYKLDVNGSVGVDQYIYHKGDNNTYLRFTTDRFRAVVGNLNMIDITENGTQDTFVINESGGDVDFRVESDTDTHALFLEGSSGNVGIGTSSPGSELEVDGETTTTNLSYPYPTATNQFHGEIVTFGTFVTGINNGDIQQGDIIVYTTAGTNTGWFRAQGNTTYGKKMLGIAMGSSPSDGILIKGFARDTHFSTTGDGDVLYLSASSAGDAADSPPGSTNNIVRIIGYMIDDSTDTIFFDPDKSWVQVS